MTETKPASAEDKPPVPKDLDTRPIAIDMLREGFREVGSVVRLVFGLSTGAVVLFVNVLVYLHTYWWLLALLALAIVSFGVLAIRCLFILLDFANFSMKMAALLVDSTGDWQSKTTVELSTWQENAKAKGFAAQRMFVFAVMLTAAFVAGLILTKAVN